jgi:thymidylate synthase
MSKFDLIYKELVNEIIREGVWDKDQDVRPRWADGTPAYTKSLITYQIKLDNGEVPILTTKKVAWKWAIHEILWFYVKRTSDVSYLKEHGVTIWNEWTREDGTIGAAYGYQLGKPIIVQSNKSNGMVSGIISNQVSNLIKELKNNPSSRRQIISLWNIDDLWNMSLYPCIWSNQWIVQDGKLHLVVQSRSSDVALGLPFNVFQYYVLQRMVAQVTGYKIGTLTFNINCPHVYERHIGNLINQMQREPYPAPKLMINPNVKNFDDFTIDDFVLEDYQHHEPVHFEVAI